MVSAEEAFAALGIHRDSGYRAMRAGRFLLPVIRIGRAIRIPRAALEELIERGNCAGYSSGRTAMLEVGEHAEPNQMTLDDYLVQRWIPLRAMSLRPSTLNMYEVNFASTWLRRQWVKWPARSRRRSKREGGRVSVTLVVRLTPTDGGIYRSVREGMVAVVG